MKKYLLFVRIGVGKILILSILFTAFGVLNMNAQLFKIDFNSDICSGDGCDLTKDLIADGCVYLVNPEIPVLPLSGFAKITNNDCDTWIFGGGLNLESVKINKGPDRKLIFHKNADIAIYGLYGTSSLNFTQGIFVEIPSSLIGANFFYEVYFDMEQIFPYGCSYIDEESGAYHQYPSAPTVNIYSKQYTDGNIEEKFEVNNNSHNEVLKSSSNFIGLYTTNGMTTGIYRSPKFQFITPGLSEHYITNIQLAFFNENNDAGICDDPKPQSYEDEGSQYIPLSLLPSAALIDNIVIDCDSVNIVFSVSSSKAALDEFTNCNQGRYKVELSTDCPNVNYNNFPYSVSIVNSTHMVVKSFDNVSGKTFYFSIDDLPTDDYEISISYINSTGYNILVNEYLGGPDPIYFHHEKDAPYRVTGTEIFDDISYVPTDIVIMPGGHLIVNNTMYMKQNKKIYVNGGGRLDVTTNGHLTTCDTEWFGVIVAGTGQVYVNGTISNSIFGITTHTDAQAKIHTNDAHFYDNRIVHVNAHASSEVSFINTDFTGGERGVYLINVTGGTTPNGVLFDGNRFSYQTKEGNLAVNTEIKVVNGNQFEGCEEGIAFRNLLGSFDESLIGGDVGPSNVFSNCGKGIYANVGKQKVQKNRFSSCNNATWMSGKNGYESEFNSFSGGYNAEGLFGAGSTTNISQHNDYNGAIYSIRTYFDNNNYTFLANCFNSAGTDVEAYGTVSGAQGNQILAASNCFTHVNYVVDLDCNTNQFQYFVPDSTIAYPFCLDPMTPGTYDIIANSFSSNEGQCGSSLATPFIGEYDYIKALGCDSIRIHTYILDYRAQLKTLLRKQVPLTKAERASVAWMTRHMRYLISQWAWCLRKQGKNPELYEWYRLQEDKDYAINAVGVRVSMQQYESALAELDQIQTDYEMNPSLIAAMKLNVVYMRTDMTPDSISPTQLDLLRSVAAISDPYAAYGRSLLYLLTEEKIEPALPSNVHLRSVESSVNAPIKETYRAYPNPASDILNISIDNMGMYDSYQYELKDVTGRNLILGNIYQDTSVDIASLSGGIYFLNILKNKELVSNQKIAITK